MKLHFVCSGAANWLSNILINRIAAYDNDDDDVDDKADYVAANVVHYLIMFFAALPLKNMYIHKRIHMYILGMC